MSKIRKVIIPAAGLGTRFLPATKSTPKEMFPIIDTPTLQYIVEEARSSGITDVGIIVSQKKPSIENHFSCDSILEERLFLSNKLDELKIVQDVANMVKIHFIVQEEPKGLGHAILCAKEFIDGEDFAIMLGDDLIVNRGGEPVLKQLVNAYEKTSCSILGVQEVLSSEVHKYGVIGFDSVVDELFDVKNMVEKPKENAPSNFAVLGRYILTNTIFDELEKIPYYEGREIQLTEGIKNLLRREKVYGCPFVGTRYDIGDKFGFIKATIDFALDREDLKDKVMEYLKKVVE